MIRHLLLATLAGVAFPIIPDAPARSAPANTVVMAQYDHISVQLIGRGSPVILVPGLSTPREIWNGVAPELARSHSVYLVQVNGFAGEDPRANLKPGLLAGVVEDIHALIQDQKLARPAFIGHSLGGLIGLSLARRYPNALSKLMVVDALPWSGALFGATVTPAMILPRATAIRDQMIASYGKPTDPAGADATAGGLTLKPDSRAKVAAWSRASDPRVTGFALYDDLTTDLRAEMGSVTTPITLVFPWSAKEPQVVAEAFYRGEYAKAPHVTFVPIADSAHFVMLDQPAAFAAAVTAFVK